VLQSYFIFCSDLTGIRNNSSGERKEKNLYLNQGYHIVIPKSEEFHFKTLGTRKGLMLMVVKVLMLLLTSTD
jgi:hypothetical protein